MKTRAYSDSGTRISRCGLVVFTTLLAATVSVHAQGQISLGFAEYQNIWYTSAPAVIPGLRRSVVGRSANDTNGRYL
jgi:hypothetical protein